jgi:excisionase family DNA binding protein
VNGFGSNVNATDDQHPHRSRLTLTVEQAAELLGISRGSAYQAVKTGEIPSLHIGGRILVPRALLLELLLGDHASKSPETGGEA